MQRYSQRGFNIIEMLVVIAIVGVLVAIAIPQYQDYVMRAKWQDALRYAGPLKEAISRCAVYHTNLGAPKCQTAVELIENGYLHRRFSVATGPVDTSTYGATIAIISPSTITPSQPIITFSGVGIEELGDCAFSLVPSFDSRSIVWNVQTGFYLDTSANKKWLQASKFCTGAQTGLRN